MMMKYGMICLSIVLCFEVSGKNKLTNIEHHSFHELTTEQSKYYTLKVLENRLYDDSENLLLAKNSLLNGEHEKAKLFLERILKKDRVTTIIKNRYLALIYFHAQDYEKSLSHLKGIDPTLPTEFKEICLLKL